jgi:hypothetical protein
MRCRFDEFHPFLPAQHAQKQYQEFPDFNTAVDTFFSQLESQKLDVQAAQQVCSDAAVLTGCRVNVHGLESFQMLPLVV